MKYLCQTILLSLSLFIIIKGMSYKTKFIIDERYVCTVKKSCKECLKLPHCSWCTTENECFSKELKQHNKFCVDNTTEHHDYGLSFEENAACSCSLDNVEQDCYPPGVTTGPECSGRGTCVCGQCVCASPYLNEPTKMVMGEYCEFDNFSCEGPKCTEGPYYINQLNDLNADDGSVKTNAIEDQTPVS